MNQNRHQHQRSPRQHIGRVEEELGKGGHRAGFRIQDSGVCDSLVIVPWSLVIPQCSGPVTMTEVHEPMFFGMTRPNMTHGETNAGS